jgi:hypothetical protein
MLSIFSSTVLIAVLAISPCLIAPIKVFLKFGALEEMSYHKIIWLKISKTLKEEKSALSGVMPVR